MPRNGLSSDRIGPRSTSVLAGAWADRQAAERALLRAHCGRWLHWRVRHAGEGACTGGAPRHVGRDYSLSSGHGPAHEQLKNAPVLVSL